MKYSGIGGQAVIEGIMMRNGNKAAVAVRLPDGSITVDTKEYQNFSDSHKWAKLPVIRGAVNFVDSMKVGINTLMYSASFFEDDEDTEPSKFETWLTEKFGDKTDKVIITVSTAISLVLALLVFLWLPLLIAWLFRRFI